MLHGFSKPMFHRKFHRALLGLKMSWLQPHPKITGTAIGFTIVAAIICFFVGPVGSCMRRGFLVFHAVANVLAALMDPKTLAQTKTPSDSN